MGIPSYLKCDAPLPAGYEEYQSAIFQTESILRNMGILFYIQRTSDCTPRLDKQGVPIPDFWMEDEGFKNRPISDNYELNVYQWKGDSYHYLSSITINHELKITFYTDVEFEATFGSNWLLKKIKVIEDE